MPIKQPQIDKKPIALALSLLLLSTPSFSATPCEQYLNETRHVLSGTFQRKSDAIHEITSFPLFASSNRLAYAVCRPDKNDEKTLCQVSVLARQGAVFKQKNAREIPLRGCEAGDTWSPDCPDFTAEGFTVGNAGKLAESLKRSRAQICRHFGTDKVTALSPVPGSAPSPSGLDRDTYFELLENCQALGAASAAKCSAALQVRGRNKASGVLMMRAGDREPFACSARGDGSLEACLVD